MALKTCTRGHRYEGPGGCPVCWSGNRRGGAKAVPARPSRRKSSRPAAAATRKRSKPAKRAAARSPRRSR